MKATLADVAKLAGVSPMTASRALRGSDQVIKKTKKKVLAAAKQLNYTPNSAARALATGQTNVIGVVIPSVTNAVFADVLKGCYSAAEESGLTLQLANSRYLPEKEEELLRVFISQRPMGLILAGIDQTPASVAMLRELTIPVVQIMDLTDDPIDTIIGFSNFQAAAAAGAHLLAKGYRKPGFLGARLDPRTLRRMQGYRSALESAGRFDEDRFMLTPDASSVSLGARLLRGLFEKCPDTDAVFCNNDDLALGALFEAQRLGLSVPNDLGICGFNDLEAVAVAEPGITSVKTNRLEIGRLAVSRIIAKADRKQKSDRVLDLGFEVIARGSTDRRV